MFYMHLCTFFTHNVVSKWYITMVGSRSLIWLAGSSRHLSNVTIVLFRKESVIKFIIALFNGVLIVVKVGWVSRWQITNTVTLLYMVNQPRLTLTIQIYTGSLAPAPTGQAQQIPCYFWNMQGWKCITPCHFWPPWILFHQLWNYRGQFCQPTVTTVQLKIQRLVFTQPRYQPGDQDNYSYLLFLLNIASAVWGA